jgi:hypothetical protein
MNNTEPSPYIITRQDTKGIHGGPERTMLIEGPTTAVQTFELASRLTPLILTFLSPFQGTLSNIGGIPSSDDQIILSLSDSNECNLLVKARFEVINSREIKFSQHPLHPELPTPFSPVTELNAGLSWYRPTRFVLFNIGTPTLYEYFELRCHTTLWLKLGTSPSKLTSLPCPHPFTTSLLELLRDSHGLKVVVHR